MNNEGVADTLKIHLTAEASETRARGRPRLSQMDSVKWDWAQRGDGGDCATVLNGGENQNVKSSMVRSSPEENLLQLFGGVNQLLTLMLLK